MLLIILRRILITFWRCTRWVDIMNLSLFNLSLLNVALRNLLNVALLNLTLFNVGLLHLLKMSLLNVCLLKMGLLYDCLLFLYFKLLFMPKPLSFFSWKRVDVLKDLSLVFYLRWGHGNILYWMDEIRIGLLSYLMCLLYINWIY